MRFCYLNTANIYPHDKHLISGLRELGHQVREIGEVKRLKKEASDADAVIVGFTSPILAIKAGLLSPKKTIFNATSSQFEANVISRGTAGSFGLGAVKWWIIDFLSFHLSTKILLESDAQIEYVHRLFFVPRRKLVRSLSGVDEKEFFYDLSVKKKAKFTVLFRGRFLPESGVLTVIEAAKKLESTGIEFLIIGHGFLHREVDALVARLRPKNLTIDGRKLPIEELRRTMLECHISLGQLADHPRLERTLPCKLFESIAMAMPYVTGRNRAALEVLTDNVNCVTVNPGDASDLASKILTLEKDRTTLDRIGRAGYQLHRDRLTSAKLTQEVLDGCFK